VPTARELTTPDVTCTQENDTVLDAARKLAELNVCSLPICGADNRPKGGSPIAISWSRYSPQGRGPASITAGELGQGKPVTVGADDDAAEVLRAMGQHRVRRLPVIDGDDLVGIIALADVVRASPDRATSHGRCSRLSELSTGR
jgi:CBS domain-containing protein